MIYVRYKISQENYHTLVLVAVGQVLHLFDMFLPISHCVDCVAPILYTDPVWVGVKAVTTAINVLQGWAAIKPIQDIELDTKKVVAGYQLCTTVIP